MELLKVYRITLRDSRVNVELSYDIPDCPSGDTAIGRARMLACVDSDLPYTKMDLFQVVLVEEIELDRPLVV